MRDNAFVCIKNRYSIVSMIHIVLIGYDESNNHTSHTTS